MWSALLWTLLICRTVHHVSCHGHLENVALSKPCKMSSYFGNDKKHQNDGRFAVNNNTEGDYTPDNYTNCIHTKDGYDNSWWEVNLGRPYPVYNITVWARTGHEHRMAYCRITVDDKPCYQFPDNIADLKRKINVNCTDGVVNGSVVRLAKDVSKKGLSGSETTINICEFQIWSCSARYWDSGCDQVCGECLDGSPCDKVTGRCDSGCKNPGLQPPLCTQACREKSFGLDCNETCSSNCQDVCNKVSGRCTCNPGWKGLTCLEECADGHYGQDCEEECGACRGGACHHVNGSCQQCEDNYIMPLCKASATSAANVGATVGGVAGGAAVFVLVVVVGVVVLCLRRRRSPKQKPDDSDRVAQHTLDDLTQPPNVYENCHAVQGAHDGDQRQIAVVKPSQAHKPKSKSKPATAVGAVYVNVGQRQQSKGSSECPTSQNDTLDDADMNPADEARLVETVFYNDVEYMTSQAVTLGLDRVQQYLLDKLRGYTLDGEFEGLPAGHRKPTVVGLEDENRPKNRFNSSILPYDKNRVVLHGDGETNSNDYINANYIKGRTVDKTYIAAQGPKTNTVVDFWNMVWQEKTTHIVMLTNLKEGEKNKCAEYWPPKGARRKYGSFTVTSVDEAQRADYLIRTFEIMGKGGKSARHVTQYHFVTWPDHHVPTATALVDFWRTVVTSHHNQRSQAPLLVHCSAGVGRTGTFIALDIAMDGAQNQPEIDIFHIVQRMREDRVNMVQTKSQYRFVHEAILEAYTSRHARLALLSFNSFFPDDIKPGARSDRIDSEYKVLNQMKVLLHKPSLTVAEHEDNVGKNRTLHVLPDDSHIVHLTKYVRGRNQYINAVYMPTFFARQGCFVTQLPLPHTLVDIWRLVDGNDVTTVVSLGAEVEGHQEYCCYWPRREGQAMTFGPFTLTLISKSLLGDCLTSYKLSFRSEDSSAGREVRLLQYKGWTGEVADNTSDLLQLVDLVNSQPREGEEGSTPVVIQCLDGASKSGLFCAICVAISRMTYDQNVDVYMGVRHLQAVRHECVTSEVQYRYIYHVIQEYQRRNSVYNNA